MKPQTSSPTSRTSPLSLDAIVDAACGVIERDGLGGLSMRKLGRELSVDPMTVYHYVPSKTALLSLVMARTVGAMAPPDLDSPWADSVRQWALQYWEVAASNRDLVLAGLSDPEIGAGGLPSTQKLIAAIANSGLPDHLLEPSAFVIVDAVHGSALGIAALHDTSEGRVNARQLFETGLDIIIAGIAARASSAP